MKCIRCGSALIETTEKGFVCGTCGKVQEPDKPIKQPKK